MRSAGKWPNQADKADQIPHGTRSHVHHHPTSETQTPLVSVQFEDAAGGDDVVHCYRCMY